MNATSAMGWALLHFLWQGALIALLAKFLLAALPARLALLRYALAVGALVVMLATVLLSAWLQLHASASVQSAATPALRSAEAHLPGGEDPLAAETRSSSTLTNHSDPGTPTARTDPSWRRRVDGALPWIVGTWVVGVLACSLRLLSGYSTTRRLVRGRGEPPPAALKALLERLAVRLGVRRAVRVCTTGMTRVPAVAGWLSPVVLLPASVVTGLSPAQLEAILAHELAHVRRHDYLANVLQSLIETLLFYHPAVWWLGARIREEREHCCDDLAVAACGSAPLYAEALLSMERLRGAPALAPALTGGSLLARVERLLAPRRRSPEVFPRWMAGLSAAAIVLVFVFVATSDLARASSRRGDAPPDEPSAIGVGDVLFHPDPSRPLSRRNEWARMEASRRGYGEYWVGHAIAPSPDSDEGILMARFDLGGGLVLDDGEGNLTVLGRVLSFGRLGSLRLPGVALAPLVGADPAEVGVLYRCSARAGGPVVSRVHVTTASLAVELEGRPLLWLGRADDRESVQDALARFERAETTELRGDLLGVVGAHGTPALVVPELTHLLGSASLDQPLRAAAAESLAYQPVPEALRALDGAARSDPSEWVRREAAESLGELRFAPAAAALIALARELEDPAARREAVESLGLRTEPGALAALEELALHDRDRDIQREAVDALGSSRRPGDGALADHALDIVAALAADHPFEEVRVRAVKTLAARWPRPRTAALFERLLGSERSPLVRAALEARE